MEKPVQGLWGKRILKMDLVGWGGGSLELWREPFEFVLKVTNHAGHAAFQSWVMCHSSPPPYLVLLTLIPQTPPSPASVGSWEV